MQRAICICIVALLGFAGPAQAKDEATNCHCYQKPQAGVGNGAADPLLLATTQNSIMAALYGIPKGAVVQNKMLGTSGDDLWIAFELAGHFSPSWSELLLARRQKSSWQELLQERGLNPLPAYLESLPEETWGRAIVDLKAARWFDVSTEDIAALRMLGAADQEILLAALLSWKTGRSGRLLFQEARAAEVGWGALAEFAEVNVDNIDGLVNSLIHP